MNVSRITIGRLFNLGNYEHVRYELTVDVKEGESAAAALQQTERILEALNPSAHKKARAIYEQAVKLSPEEFPKRITTKLGRIEFLAELKKQIALHDGAVAALDYLGGSAIYKDAKNDWEDQF